MRGESPADENECREKQWGPHSEAAHRGRDRKEEVGGSSSEAGKSQVTEAGGDQSRGKELPLGCLLGRGLQRGYTVAWRLLPTWDKNILISTRKVKSHCPKTPRRLSSLMEWNL